MIEVRAELSSETFLAVEDLLYELADAIRWNLFEDLANKQCWIQGIFETEEDARSSWGELIALGHLDAEPKYLALEDKNWKESYKEHFKPWSIGPMHWVPEWLRESYELPSGHTAVWLDPGLAFGTGNHGTTRLCVEQLIAYKESGVDLATAKVVDAGCGSGILAISAAKLGFENLSAFDNDAEAVEIAKENAAFNGTGTIPFFTGDLKTGFVGEPADCIMANILANVLMEFSKELIDAVAPGGWLILSGILGKEAEEVRDHFLAAGGLSGGSITYLDEWSAIRFLRL